MNTDLEAMERDAYRASYSDGMVDIFVGLSVLVIGAIWIWAEDYGGLAGILPAVMASSLVSLRKRVVEARGGYVKWGAPRRQWERRNLWGAVGAGVVTFLLGIGAFFMFESGGAGRDLLSDIAPGLIAFILAVVAIVLGIVMAHWRFYAYGAVLVVGGVWAAAAETNPGLPLVVAGIVVAVVGTIMLTRYLQTNPRVDA